MYILIRSLSAERRRGAVCGGDIQKGATWSQRETLAMTRPVFIFAVFSYFSPDGAINRARPPKQVFFKMGTSTNNNPRRVQATCSHGQLILSPCLRINEFSPGVTTRRRRAHSTLDSGTYLMWLQQSGGGMNEGVTGYRTNNNQATIAALLIIAPV